MTTHVGYILFILMCAGMSSAFVGGQEWTAATVYAVGGVGAVFLWVDGRDRS